MRPDYLHIDDIDQIETAVSNKTPDYIFEHRDEFLKLLEVSGPTLMGDIAEFRPELEGHHENQVMLAEIEFGQKQKDSLQGSSKIRFFEIMYEGQPIIAVFKPSSGENPARLEDFQVPRMYTRERAAYVVDYFMDLGIVPPTVLKQIDDEVGSLQLYIPHTTAQSPNINAELSQNQDFSGPEWKKMAMFDVLIDNADRNNGNYLVCLSDPSRCFAIDHGCSFCRTRSGDENRAYNYFRNNPDQAVLDDNLRDALQRLIDSEQEVMAA